MTFTETITDLGTITFRDSKWRNSKYQSLKETSTTEKGDWGENLLCKILSEGGLPTTRHNHGRGGYDVEAPGHRTEVKLATEDTSGKFQFNGLDLDRDFDAGFLLGVSPEDLFFLYLPKKDLHPKNFSGFSKWTLHPTQMVRLTEENFWASWTLLNAEK